jgi:hypothetical protein
MTGAKLGLSNADLLARDMNTLASFVRENDPGVMPLFWGDMIHPLHNGGTLLRGIYPIQTLPFPLFLGPFLTYIDCPE